MQEWESRGTVFAKICPRMNAQSRSRIGNDWSFRSRLRKYSLNPSLLTSSRFMVRPGKYPYIQMPTVRCIITAYNIKLFVIVASFSSYAVGRLFTRRRMILSDQNPAAMYTHANSHMKGRPGEYKKMLKIMLNIAP
jgi:hypothetical protein